LSAQNAPIRTILAEWARLGGTTIVNAEKVAGAPVTIELSGVPERQALDIVLRSVAGYMLAPRPAGTEGASAFNRIVILPTSAAPRNPPPAANAVARPPVPRPATIARPPDLTGDLPPEVEEMDPVAAQDPGPFNQPRIAQPPFQMRPAVQDENADMDEPTSGDTDAAAPAGVAPTPTNPFGVPFGSSTTPGVVSPAPQPAGPNRASPNRVQ
jgi:hypothetical protein